MQRPLAVGLTGAAFLWTVLLVVIPLGAAGDAPRLTAAVYAMGALVCHQRAERSFHVHGTQVPVCARCAGLYVSGAAGLLAGWLGCPREPRRARALVVACALPMGLSVGLEWTGLAAGSNPMRAASALPAGGVVGWLLVRMLRGEARRMRYDLVV